MPFENDRNVNITITVEDRDANARLEKIANSLERLADTSGNQLNRNLQGTTDALRQASRAADRGSSGFSNFQKNLITLDASLRVVRRGVNAVRNSITGFFESLGEAQQIEGLSRSFERLQASIGQDATTSIQRLRTATQGLVSDLDLFRAANEAVLLRVDDGTGSFERLTQAAVKLGQATGRTAAEAIGDLTQGIGRQSRLILDNLGIVVRAEAAYEAYAESVGVAVKDLSEFEKQAAFTAAATEAITTKAAELAGVQETAGSASLRLSAAVENLTTRFLTALSANTELADAVNSLAATFDEVDAVGLASDIANLSAAFINFANTLTSNATAALAVFVENAKTAADFIADIRDGVAIGTTAKIRLDFEGALEIKRDTDLARSALERLDNLKLTTFKNEFKITTENVVAARKAILDLQRAVEGGRLGPTISADLSRARDRLKEVIREGKEANISLRGLSSDGLAGSSKAMTELANTTAGASRALRLLENIPLDDTFGKVAEDVGKARVAFSLLQAAQQAGIPLSEQQAAALTKVSAALARVGVANTKLTAEQKAAARESEKLASSLEQLISNMGGVSTAAEQAAEQLTLDIEIAKALGATTEQTAQKVKEFFQELEKSKGPKAAAEALKAYEKSTEDAARATDRLRKEIDKITRPLEEMAGLQAGPAIDQLSGSLRFLVEQAISGEIPISVLKERLESLEKAGELGADGLRKVGNALDEAAEKAKKAKAVFDDLFGTGVLGDFVGRLDESLNLGLLGAEGILGEDIGEAIGGNIINGITSAIETGDIEGALGDVISGSFAATGEALAGPVGGAIGQRLGDAVAANFSEALDGNAAAAVGSFVDTIFPGIGTALTPVFESIGLGDLFGGREDPFRDARNNFESFISDLEESTGFDLGFDFDIGGFQEVIKTSNEVKEIFGETFENFTTQLDDGTFAVNQFSIEMAELGQTADRELVATFDGIGTSIAASMGLAGEELAQFGQQFGQLLAVNLEDPLGLNRLQLLFQQAGLSAEELGAAIEDAYFRGDISAGEFLNAQSKTENLFEQGIPGAVGATDAAFANLVTGGLSSGQEAMDAFGDLAVEATEKGITSFEELSASLIESGASVTDVNLLFEQLAANGITTIEALKEISLPQAAEMIADLEQVGFGFQEIGDQITTARELLQQFRAETTQPITQRVNVEFALTGDQAAIDAGLTSSLTGSDGGESGRVFLTLSNFSGEQP